MKIGIVILCAFVEAATAINLSRHIPCVTQPCPKKKWTRRSEEAETVFQHDEIVKPRTREEQPLQDLAEWLSWYLGQLGSFVVDIEFDYKRFALQGPELAIQLVKISRNVQALDTPSTDLFVMLKFATYMYRVMMEATHIIETHNDVSVASNKVRSMAQLNVAFLALPLRYSTTKTSVREYADNIFSYNAIMDRWRDDFVALSEVSDPTKRAFHHQFTLAKQTFSGLHSYLPTPSEMHSNSKILLS